MIDFDAPSNIIRLPKAQVIAAQHKDGPFAALRVIHELLGQSFSEHDISKGYKGKYIASSCSFNFCCEYTDRRGRTRYLSSSPFYARGRNEHEATTRFLAQLLVPDLYLFNQDGPVLHHGETLIRSGIEYRPHHSYKKTLPKGLLTFVWG